MSEPTLTLASGETVALPSLIAGLPADVYHASGDVSASGLKAFRRSPAHYRYGAPKTSDEFRFGTFFHSFILEPALFLQSYIVEPADAPKRPTKAQLGAKKPAPETIAQIEYWRAWDAENAGKTVVTVDEHKALSAMLASVRAHTDAASIMRSSGTSETSAFALHETGLVVRSRFDFMPSAGPWSDAIVDVKTAQDASDAGFGRDAARYGYVEQAAFYLDVARRTTARRGRFVFIAVEKLPPYAVNVFTLSEDSPEIAQAHERNEASLRLLAECREVDSWPGYGSRAKPLQLPSWYLKQPTQTYDHDSF